MIMKTGKKPLKALAIFARLCRVKEPATYFKGDSREPRTQRNNCLKDEKMIVLGGGGDTVDSFA